MIELIGKQVYLDNNFEIKEYYTDSGIVRTLLCDGCLQSTIFVEEEKRIQLALEYFNFYNLPVDLNTGGTDYLMLGGGAISYPHYYLNKYNNKNIDIVEVNEKCIEYAKKYFFLNDLLLSNKERINIIIDDAIDYISFTDKQYDFVLIDLFNGRFPVKEIYSEYNIIKLKKILKNNGVLLINYIISNDLDKKIINKIIENANNYKIISNEEYFDFINNIGNIIIIISNNEINIPNSYNYMTVNIM